MISSNFKKQYSYENRLEESRRVLDKYPDRKPVICEKSKKEYYLPDIDKIKYLVPDDLTLGQFIYVVRQRLHLNPEEALFLFVNNKFIPVSTMFSQVYSQERDPDGFLYLQYTKENVFG